MKISFNEETREQVTARPIRGGELGPVTIWTKGEHTGDELDDNKLNLSRQLRAYIGELAGYLGMTTHKIFLSTSS